ncbi:MAG: DUF4956 domain-containing protein [Rhodoglobus sp.]
MVTAVMIAIDLVAIVILIFGLYFPRHRRKDLVVAFLTVNVGVLAVSLVLASMTVGLGVGLGLFGVLSIIRLRSSEIKQHEIAYYFAALALGLLAGLSTTVDPLIIGLMVLMLAVMLIGDHPRLFGTYRMQTMQLDTAYTDETALTAALEGMLGARVHHVTVRHVDLINDSTLVEVRYQLESSYRTVETHERLDAR